MGFGQYYGEPFMIFPLLTGGDLDRYKNTPLDANTFAVILKQVLDALRFMHTRNLVHGDIKPDNIVFETRASDVLKLIDLGCCEDVNDNNRNMVICPAGYLPPECSLEFEWDTQVDIFSLGCVMYELVHKQRLFPKYRVWNLKCDLTS